MTAGQRREGAGRSYWAHEVKIGSGVVKKRVITQCFANVHVQHTNTRTNEVSAQVHWHTLFFANTPASCQKLLNCSLGGKVDATILAGQYARQEKVREDGTQPWLISDNWKYILLKPMQRGPPSKTEETMTLGQRGTYTITFILHSACVRVCVLCRDIATFFLNFFFIKCPTHTHSHSLLQILVFTMEHVFSGWHMYMQSISLTCSGKTEGKESGGRKR